MRCIFAVALHCSLTVWCATAAKDVASVEVVVAHHSEDLSWLEIIPRAVGVRIFTHGPQMDLNIPVGRQVAFQQLPNVGRESFVYLKHIVDNYQGLADWTVFTQAGEPTFGYKGHRSGGGHLLAGDNFLNYLTPAPSGARFVYTSVVHLPSMNHLLRAAYVIDDELLETGAASICPKDASFWTPWFEIGPFRDYIASKVDQQNGEQVMDFYHKHINPSHAGNEVTAYFSQGARFAVSREIIQRRPRAVYEQLLATLNKTDDPYSGYFMEWLWAELFIGHKQPCSTPAITHPVSHREAVQSLFLRFPKSVKRELSVTGGVSGGVSGGVQAGVISAAKVTPNSLVAGASGTAVVSFTMATALPTNGKIVITFPTGFDIATNKPAANSATSAVGSFTTAVTNQVLTITRAGDAAFAGPFTDLTLTNIGNPHVSGDTGTFTITTTDSAGAAIDTLTSVPLVAITVGAISIAKVTPNSLVAGASGTAVVGFTMANALPTNGKIVITFPTGFDIATNKPAASSVTSAVGSFTTAVTNQVLTITRAGSAAFAGPFTDLTLTNVKNPPQHGNTGTFTITTKNSAGAAIDTLTSVPLVVITQAKTETRCTSKIGATVNSAACQCGGTSTGTACTSTNGLFCVESGTEVTATGACSKAKTEAPTTVITGSLTMTVPNAAEFKKDTAAQDAVKAGIAAVVTCDVKYITLSITIVGATGRRLAASVEVTYTITIPGTASGVNPTEVTRKLNAATAASLTTKIIEQIRMKKDASYDVSVNTKSAVSASTRATCSTIATVASNFCGSGKVYDSTKHADTCAADPCNKATTGDATACCKTPTSGTTGTGDEVSSTSETSLVGEIVLVGAFVVHVANSLYLI